jgi:hypothetical protein
MTTVVPFFPIIGGILSITGGSVSTVNSEKIAVLELFTAVHCIASRLGYVEQSFKYLIPVTFELV